MLTTYSFPIVSHIPTIYYKPSRHRATCSIRSIVLNATHTTPQASLSLSFTALLLVFDYWFGFAPFLRYLVSSGG